LMVISGADRSLVNLKLAGNQIYQKQSALLAELAIGRGIQKLRLQPELIKTKHILWLASHPNGHYKSASIPMGADRKCHISNVSKISGTRWHAEIIGSGYSARNTMTHYAMGISVCEAGADGDFDEIIIRYWRTIDQDELSAMMDI
ncbi:MAG: hypothetical protein P8R04_02980, partial [Gammaproteobacteria bacterium]|nr:hypothetical protein [Gammaproteobacteria bacterium]